MNRTIEYVQPEVREWKREGKPPAYFVQVNFDDESVGSMACWAKADVDPTVAALKALIGQPVEMTLEDDGEYQGTKKWRIKDFPGKPAGSGGGGGGRGGGGMSHAQVGILAAATLLAPSDGQIDARVAEVIRIGEVFTEHLFSRKPPETQAPAAAEGAPAEAEPATPAVDRITLPQTVKLKELAKQQGYDDVKLLEALGVGKLSDVTKQDADLLIESWS